MEWLINFITENAQYAHIFFFFSLMLAGLNLPISEDLVVISGGVFASTVIPANRWLIFFSIFAGAYISDWICYWIGRLLGPKLWKIRWLARVLKPGRFRRLEHYYQRYGMLTLLIGRFIPFGVRNCLFMTAGLGKMVFWRFLIADGIACLIMDSLLFWLAYCFARNYETLLSILHKVDVLLIVLFGLALIAFLCYKWRKRVVRGSDTL